MNWARVRIKQGISVATHGAATVLVDLKAEAYFALDDVGSRIWTMLDSGNGVDMIACRVATEYSRPAEEVLRDVRTFVEELLRHNLVVSG